MFIVISVRNRRKLHKTRIQLYVNQCAPYGTFQFEIILSNYNRTQAVSADGLAPLAVYAFKFYCEADDCLTILLYYYHK